MSILSRRSQRIAPHTPPEKPLDQQKYRTERKPKKGGQSNPIFVSQSEQKLPKTRAQKPTTGAADILSTRMQPAISSPPRPLFLETKLNYEKNCEELYKLLKSANYSCTYSKHALDFTFSKKTIRDKYLAERYQPHWNDFFSEKENTCRGSNIGETGHTIFFLKETIYQHLEKIYTDIKTQDPEARLIDLKQLKPQRKPQTPNRPLSSRIHAESSSPPTPGSPLNPTKLFMSEDMKDDPKYKKTKYKRKRTVRNQTQAAGENKAKMSHDANWRSSASIHPTAQLQEATSETKEEYLPAANYRDEQITMAIEPPPSQPQGVTMPVEPHSHKEQRAAAEDSPHQQTSEPNQDRDNAATEIQRIYRGRSARKKTSEKKQNLAETTPIPSPRDYELEAHPESPHEALPNPQQKRKEVETKANTLPDQVTVLETQVKEIPVSTSPSRKQNETIDVVASLMDHPAIDEKQQTAAAIQIQKILRGRSARKKTSEKKQNLAETTPIPSPRDYELEAHPESPHEDLPNPQQKSKEVETKANTLSDQVTVHEPQVKEIPVLTLSSPKQAAEDSPNQQTSQPSKDRDNDAADTIISFWKKYKTRNFLKETKKLITKSKEQREELIRRQNSIDANSEDSPTPQQKMEEVETIREPQPESHHEDFPEHPLTKQFHPDGSEGHEPAAVDEKQQTAAAIRIQRLLRRRSARNQEVEPKGISMPGTILPSHQQPVPITGNASLMETPAMDKKQQTAAEDSPHQQTSQPSKDRDNDAADTIISFWKKYKTRNFLKETKKLITKSKEQREELIRRQNPIDANSEAPPTPQQKREKVETKGDYPPTTETKEEQQNAAAIRIQRLQRRRSARNQKVEPPKNQIPNTTKSRPPESKTQEKKSNPKTEAPQTLPKPIPITIPHPYVTPPPPPHCPGPHVSENVSKYMLLSEKVEEYKQLIIDLEQDEQLKQLHDQKDELTEKQSTTEDEDKQIEQLKIQINQIATEKENKIEALHQEIFVNTGIENALKTYASTTIENALTMSAKSWETTLLQNFAIEVQNGSITPDLRNNPDAIAYFNEYYKDMGVQINLNTASNPLPPSSPRHTPAPESRPRPASPTSVADTYDLNQLTPRTATSSNYIFSELPNEQKYKPFTEAGFQKLTIPGNGDCLPVSLILKELMEAQALLNEGNMKRMEELYNLLKSIFDNNIDKEKLIYHNCKVVIDTLKDIIDGKNDLSLYNIFYDVCSENDNEYAHMFCQGLAKLVRLSVVPLCIEKFSETFFQEYLKKQKIEKPANELDQKSLESIATEFKMVATERENGSSLWLSHESICAFKEIFIDSSGNPSTKPLFIHSVNGALKLQEYDDTGTSYEITPELLTPPHAFAFYNGTDHYDIFVKSPK